MFCRDVLLDIHALFLVNMGRFFTNFTYFLSHFSNWGSDDISESTNRKD